VAGAGSVLAVMSTTRTVRRLRRPDAVADEVLTQLVDTASGGPSAPNRQGGEDIVITDRDQIAPLSRLAVELRLHQVVERDVEEVLGLPKGIRIMALVAVRWPEGDFGRAGSRGGHRPGRGVRT